MLLAHGFCIQRFCMLTGLFGSSGGGRAAARDSIIHGTDQSIQPLYFAYSLVGSSACCCTGLYYTLRRDNASGEFACSLARDVQERIECVLSPAGCIKCASVDLLASFPMGKQPLFLGRFGNRSAPAPPAQHHDRRTHHRGFGVVLVGRFGWLAGLQPAGCWCWLSQWEGLASPPPISHGWFFDMFIFGGSCSE